MAHTHAELAAMQAQVDTVKELRGIRKALERLVEILDPPGDGRRSWEPKEAE